MKTESFREIAINTRLKLHYLSSSGVSLTTALEHQFFSCQEKLQQRAKEGKPVFEDYRWIRNPGDTSTLAPGEETRCLEDIVSINLCFNVI